MNKRLIWLAPIALAVLLSGCSVTVTTLGPIAPDSLIGYKLELINDERGGRLDTHGASVTDLDVDRELDLYFWDENTVRNPEIRVEASNWSYDRSGARGTVRVAFAHDQLSDFITTCVLTFDDHYSGSHQCEFEIRATRTMSNNIVSYGSGEGTFQLEKL